MLISNQMSYDESHCTQSFWKIDINLFIQLICGYKFGIVYKINFGLLCLTKI